MIYILGERDTKGEVSGYIKIGFVGGGPEEFAERIRRRVNGLQVGNPRQLIVLGSMPGDRTVEKALHWRFEQARVRRPQPTEWLSLADPELATWLDGLLKTPLTFGWSMHVKTPTPRMCGMHSCRDLAVDDSTRCTEHRMYCHHCRQYGHGRRACTIRLEKPSSRSTQARDACGPRVHEAIAAREGADV